MIATAPARTRHAAALLVAGTLGACATGAGERVTLPAPPPVERPTFSVGERWVFTGPRGRTEVTYQGRRGELLVFRVVFQPVGGAAARGDALYSADLSHVKEAVVESRPDDGELRFPLAVGRSWRHQFTRVTIRGGMETKEDQVTVDAKVVAYERIRVPAGEFEAFRIESTITHPAFSWKATYWYAPSAKAVIKHHTEGNALKIDRAELAEYEAAR